MSRRAVVPIAFALLGVVACGAEDEGPSPSTLADLSALQRLIARDPAVEPLSLVEERIDDERPVHAAQMLRTTGIPAARRQVEAIEGATVQTAEGRRFKRRLRDAYRARVSALEAQQEVLEGGVAVDPLEQLTALRAVRQAQEQLLGVVRQMSELVPRAEPPEEDLGDGSDEAVGAEGEEEVDEAVHPLGPGLRGGSR